MCPPMRAHLRHLENTMQIVLPSAHLSPRPKRQIDRFSRFCTFRGRKSLYYKWASLSPKLHLPIGASGSPWFLGPIRVHNPNGIWIGSAVFAGLTSVTDRQTDSQIDRPRYSVGNNRPHLRIRTIHVCDSTLSQFVNTNLLYIPFVHSSFAAIDWMDGWMDR